jgi:hypothetical protein
VLLSLGEIISGWDILPQFCGWKPQPLKKRRVIALPGVSLARLQSPSTNDNSEKTVEI